jgi:hypothetical protein
VEVSSVPETHPYLADLLNALFTSNATTKDHVYTLIELILKIKNQETQSEDTVENLYKLL